LCLKHCANKDDPNPGHATRIAARNSNANSLSLSLVKGIPNDDKHTVITVSPTASSTRPVGVAGRLAASLFLLFFLAMGLLFVWLILRDAWPGLQTWTWAQTPCEVTSSLVRETDQRGHRSGKFYPEVSFHYEFKGKSYSSSSLRRKPVSFQDYTAASRLAGNYKPESHSMCFVNPAAPGEAVLQRGSLAFPLLVLFPMVFVTIGAGGIYFTWRKAPPGSSAAKPISDHPGFKLHPGVSFVFIFVFILLGGGLCYFFLIRPLVRIAHATHWQTVPCVILSSEVQSHSSNDGSTYSVNILYAYEFNRHEYKANRYDFMGGSSSGYNGKRRIVDRLPPGAKTICYVNPLEPEDAVLVRGFTPTMWFGLIPLAFVVVGLLALVWNLRNWKSASALADSRIASTNWKGTSASQQLFLEVTDPLVLKPKASPKAKLIGFFMLALFWNGIISVFVSSAVSGWRSSPVHFFMMLFLTPFVLVGLGLIVVVVYFLLALFNPRPRITITPGTVQLGALLRVDWELSGRTEVVKNLSLRLEGREEATYRRGTTTTTDTNTFADLPIASSSAQPEVRSGSGSVTVPGNLMHSFASQHNKIIWSVRIHGEIDRWPDLQEEFPVTVLPAAPKNEIGL
jgi:hypothetical protein